MRAKIFIFFSLFFSLPCFHSQFLTLSGNETIVSPQNVFELGFFQPGLDSRWFLGIWYKEDSNRTCLWVANRDRPLSSPNGTLKFFNNDLVLFDEGSDIVWKANITGGDENSDMVFQVLDNGNLVVVKDSNDTKEDYLWQSFDSPTNTLLPQMKLKTLVSWNTSTDPASGSFSFGISTEEHFFACYVLDSFSREYWRFDPWNGYRFGDMPPVLQLDDDTDMFVMNPESNYSRLTLHPEGDYGLYTWIPESAEWELSWPSSDLCDIAERPCGSYSYCTLILSRLCNCIQGFKPKSEHDWNGCERKTALNCSGDRFLKLQNMSLPRNDTWDMGTVTATVEQCQKTCLTDCRCTAFAHVEIGKGHRRCLTWTGEFHGVRNYTLGGQDFYVKLAPAPPTDHG